MFGSGVRSMLGAGDGGDVVGVGVEVGAPVVVGVWVEVGIGAAVVVWVDAEVAG